MKNTILFLLLLTALASCSRKLYPTTLQRTDSVVVNHYTVERDTVIVAPGAIAKAEVPLQELKPGMKPISRSERQAKVSVKVNDKGRLQVDCACDTLAIAAKLKEQNTQSVRTIVETRRTEVPYVPWYIKIAAWLGLAALLLLLMRIVAIVKNKII